MGQGQGVVLAAALTLSGCTIFGASYGGALAGTHNQRRYDRIVNGDEHPGPEQSVAKRALVGGLIGAVLDTAAPIYFIEYPRPWN